MYPSAIRTLHWHFLARQLSCTRRHRTGGWPSRHAKGGPSAILGELLGSHRPWPLNRDATPRRVFSEYPLIIHPSGWRMTCGAYSMSSGSGTRTRDKILIREPLYQLRYAALTLNALWSCDWPDPHRQHGNQPWQHIPDDSTPEGGDQVAQGNDRHTDGYDDLERGHEVLLSAILSSGPGKPFSTPDPCAPTHELCQVHFPSLTLR